MTLTNFVKLVQHYVEVEEQRARFHRQEDDDLSLALFCNIKAALPLMRKRINQHSSQTEPKL